METDSKTTTQVLRPALPRDREGIVALVDTVYREYGDRICLEKYDADLLDIEGYYRARGGEFVVVSENEIILGAHAVLPLDDQPGVCTFRRLYLARELRGTGWGERLMQWAIDCAREHGFRRVEFWSDTRFTRAHAFFRRLGFVHDGRERELDDGWEPYREFFFSREL